MTSSKLKAWYEEIARWKGGGEGVGGDLVYIRKMTNSLFKNAKELNVVRINSSRMSLDAL